MTVYLSSFSQHEHPDLQQYVAMLQQKPSVAHRSPPFIEKHAHRVQVHSVKLTNEVDRIVIGKDK